jgi:hypothetical protein
MIIKKKADDQQYWPRLSKDKTKLPYLRTDFSRWVDEDEQHEQEDQGGMQGFPGMEGMDFSQFQGADSDMNFDAMMGGDDDFEEKEEEEEEEGKKESE